jgi:hypothetical protein
LLIELRGDRYVRVATGEDTSESNVTSANYQQPPVASSASGHTAVPRATVTPREPASVSSSPAPARASHELSPAILIFRDGHKESVRDYAIASGMLYARGDFYADGYWTRTINLAGLDLPATISSNAERGVKFVLPGAPNEVVTRP